MLRLCYRQLKAPQRVRQDPRHSPRRMALPQSMLLKALQKKCYTRPSEEVATLILFSLLNVPTHSGNLTKYVVNVNSRKVGRCTDAEDGSSAQSSPPHSRWPARSRRPVP